MSICGIKILDGGLSTELIRLGFNPQVKLVTLFSVKINYTKRIVNYGLENQYMIDQIF